MSFNTTKEGRAFMRRGTFILELETKTCYPTRSRAGKELVSMKVPGISLRFLLPTPKPFLMGSLLYKRQKLMLSSCARTRGQKSSQRKTLVMDELAEAAGILVDCLLLTAWVVFSLGARIKE